MPRALNKILLHLVWSTKYRQQLISSEYELEIYRFIREQFLKKDCIVLIINGMPDHIHVLFLLAPTRSIAEVVKQVKGSSARYINENKLCKTHFMWSEGYAVFAVSRHMKDRIYYYIKNQKRHHSPLASDLNHSQGGRRAQEAKQEKKKKPQVNL